MAARIINATNAFERILTISFLSSSSTDLVTFASVADEAQLFVYLFYHLGHGQMIHGIRCFWCKLLYNSFYFWQIHI